MGQIAIAFIRSGEYRPEETGQARADLYSFRII
jgi:hypothetical protein